MLNPCDALGRRKPRALMLRRPRRGRLEARGQRGAARERSGRRLAAAPKGPRSQDDPTPDGKVRANKDRSRDVPSSDALIFSLSAERSRGVPASWIASRRKSAAGNLALVRSSATLVELHRPHPRTSPPPKPVERRAPSDALWRGEGGCGAFRDHRQAIRHTRARAASLPSEVGCCRFRNFESVNREHPICVGGGWGSIP
jgi:hypothetical protein